jgi:hypothetical protein
MNVKNTLPENNNYTLKFSSEALKVFRSENKYEKHIFVNDKENP